MGGVRRIFVEKKNGFDVAAKGLYRDLKENLGIQGLTGVRIVIRYDIEGVTDEEYRASREIVFAEPPVDLVYDETLPVNSNEHIFGIEYLPGQYDQRADSAAQCIQIISHGNRPTVAAAQIFVLQGNLTDDQFASVKKYVINPVDSREASLGKVLTLDLKIETPPDVAILTGFTNRDSDLLEKLRLDLGLAMRLEDIQFCQVYFRDTEKRDPSLTEIRVLDTYWSDHCRHTTFLSNLDNVTIEKDPLTEPIREAFDKYKAARVELYANREKPMCLMDIATIGMKELRKEGKLNDLDISEEINACSIVVPVDIDGQTEDWLVMFKNETHNHPTEIEPFGGAATCLGGAIRDPLSGRSYVYQAMRVTGSGDPRKQVGETLPGKLPQSKISKLAAQGYSSYGNQIGLATGLVTEIYDEGYVAKRMEIGAVIGAAPKSNVVREKPMPGDLIVLLGGRTGRDGCGGATGSSKEHTEESISSCSAEVQKGNPPTERKIQRLFRNSVVSHMIKRCNDFGAGGVSVAIGELAEGLEIDLDAIPKKYEGLDGTELAISESQERMAVCIEASDFDAFVSLASEENLETALVAKVTIEKRLKMVWRGKTIVDISREFIDTNGVCQHTNAYITKPDKDARFFDSKIASSYVKNKDVKNAWLATMSDLNVCSQQGLIERFDSTIGAGSVLLPFGGKFQSTPIESMVAKIPVVKGETNTGTVMSFGYNPKLSSWSPFHGAVYAVVESLAKIVATGADYHSARLTLQEYFERLGTDEQKWGKPLAALLGAYWAQVKLGTPAIGGKDSMSGTFKDLTVPPTLVSFAVSIVDVRTVISPEFKKAGSTLVLVSIPRDSNDLPNFESLDNAYTKVTQSIQAGHVLAAHTVRWGGVAEAVSKMSFGNRIGCTFDNSVGFESLFAPELGSIVLELEAGKDIASVFENVNYKVLGKTTGKEEISVNGTTLTINEIEKSWREPLDKIFPAQPSQTDALTQYACLNERGRKQSSVKIARPRVLITVFPGTNCEYDTARVFEKAGAEADIFVMRNLSASDVDRSIDMMVKKVAQSQILMIPGGFSAGDEPDGSGKFIAAFFRNPKVKDAVTELLNKRDGLMLGICNGFQAIIKLGLVPYGEIRDMNEESPTLTFNTIGRHISRVAYTQICAVKSPWLANVNSGDVHAIPISHGEGRFVAPEKTIETLFKNGQVATRYVTCDGELCGGFEGNLNGSYYAIEGITSPDGRVLGKMGHSERQGQNIAKNISGNKDQKLFEAGVSYFS